jgi:hypothetical protein
VNWHVIHCKLHSYILVLFYFSALSSELEHLFDISVLIFSNALVTAGAACLSITLHFLHYVFYVFDMILTVKKLKCTLVQALRLCTGRTVHRGSRGIALLFLDHDTIRGWGSASRPGRSLPPEKSRYQMYRRLMGPRAGLDRCGKSRHHRDSIPGPSSP